jgi:hypothetical protein
MEGEEVDREVSPPIRTWGYMLHLPPRRAPINSLLVMMMPPHFVNGLFNVFRPDIGCIASSFLICCPLVERYLWAPSSEGGEAGIPRVLQRWVSKGLRHRSEHGRGDESEERDEEVLSAQGTVLHELIRSLARITKLYLGCFMEFSKPNPFF